MRVAPAMLAVTASILVLNMPAGPMTQSAAAATKERCTDWTSRDEPPPDIAVYQVREGKVERVDFELYVARVVNREWNTKPAALRYAGAVAAKQYAWYHVLRWRGGMFNGQCFDVRDTRADQLYGAKPADRIPDFVWRSVRATWTWHLFREGKFIMTGYRRGEDVRCAQDAGFRLYATSARYCVEERHWDARRLLEVYYNADLVT